jgi:dolichol-phosphate mannosyltransferase
MPLHDNFSIIIPCFREAYNIPELVHRISRIDFGGRTFEVLLIDDNSADGTLEIVTQLSRQYAWLKLIIRHQPKSLSKSVLEGFQHASHPVLIVMDADLSHPPEKIPAMLAALTDPIIDIVIGSRYIQNGSTDETWPISRKILSQFCASIARTLLTTPVQDPLSGFIALRKSTYLATKKNLNPIGWKIGLEIMVKSHCKQIKEIPIHFSQRHQGMSKLNFKIMCDYFWHLGQLVKYKIFSVN